MDAKEFNELKKNIFLLQERIRKLELYAHSTDPARAVGCQNVVPGILYQHNCDANSSHVFSDNESISSSSSSSSTLSASALYAEKNNTTAPVSSELDQNENMLFFETVNTSLTTENVYVLFDLETTGLGFTKDINITEIGAICIDKTGKILKKFRKLVCPLIEVTKKASEITHHTNTTLQKYKMWKEVGKQFFEFLEHCREQNKKKKIFLIAHNGKRYDSRILFFENLRHELEFPDNVYFNDTLSFFKERYPRIPSLGLENVFFHVFDEKIKDAHTALGDCEAIRSLIEIECLKNNDCFENWVKKTCEHSDSVEKRCLKKCS